MMKMLLILSCFIAMTVQCSSVAAFSQAPLATTRTANNNAKNNNNKNNNKNNNSMALGMGLFDGIAKAFSNEDFKSQDQRVRASHILIKGDDIDMVFGKVKNLMTEINDRTQQEPDKLVQIFSELARQNSECASAAQGGDLGMFGPGKMVKEFDAAIFPDDAAAAPPAGALMGPIVTDFGMHIILVTQREENRDQVEEKLARIDPDAAL